MKQFFSQQSVRLGVGLALGAALISGVNNFLTKIAVTSVQDPLTYTTVKNLVVALILLAICAASGAFGELRRLNRRQALVLGAVGAIGGAAAFILFFTGLASTSAVNASIIHKSLFLWVLLMAVPLRKELVTGTMILGVVALTAANLLIGGFKGFSFSTGELMILLATILWAVETIIAKAALAGLSSRLVATARMTIGAAILLVVSFSRGNLGIVTTMNATAWGWTLLTAVLLAAYVLTWYAALKRLPATLTAALLVPAALVTNVLSAGLLTHTFNTSNTVSAVLFIGGTISMLVYARSVARQPQIVGHEIA